MLRWRSKRIGISVLLLLGLGISGAIWSIATSLKHEAANHALIEAITRVDIMEVRRLIDRGADPNAHDKGPPPSFLEYCKLLLNRFRNKDGDTDNGYQPAALVIALEGREPDYRVEDTPENVAVIKTLIQHGANCNAKDPIGRSALTLAITYRSAFGADLTRFMLNHGADANTRDQGGMTPLIFASDLSPIAQWLLDHGAQVNAQDNSGRTPLMSAADSLVGENIPAVKLLLDRGADIKRMNEYGWTALTYAVNHRNPAIAKLLLERGADPNHRDKAGVTPLMVCADAGAVACSHLLLERGADPNLQSNDGWTALMYEARDGHDDMIRLLLEYGARANVKNRAGQTALDLAVRLGSVPCVRLLRTQDKEFVIDNESR